MNRSIKVTQKDREFKKIQPPQSVLRYVPKEDLDNFKKEWGQILDLIEPFKLKLLKDLDDLSNNRCSEEEFNNPNWALKQAHIQGQILILSQTLKILKNDDQSKGNK